MSKYTTEVRYICEYYAGLTESVGNDKVLDVIERSRDKVFDFDYPLYDEDYKSVLETKILSHYYTREICEETVGLWKHRLYAKLNEIMPAYNKLYEVEARKIDPMTNILKVVEGNKDKNEESQSTDYSKTNGSKTDVGEVHNTTKVDSTENVADTRQTIYQSADTVNGEVTTSYDNYKESTSSIDAYNDMPQGTLAGTEYGDFLSNVRDVSGDKSIDGSITESTNDLKTEHSGNDTTSTSASNSANSNSDSDTDTVNRSNTESETNSNGSNTAKTTDEYVEKISGYEGISYSKLLREFRDNLLNIDLMIINDLSDLFIQLW